METTAQGGLPNQPAPFGFELISDLDKINKNLQPEPAKEIVPLPAPDSKSAVEPSQGKWDVPTEVWGQDPPPNLPQRESLKTTLGRLRMKAEAAERRLELVFPESLENFMANLWWMTEQGVDEDLDVLQRIKDNNPYPTRDVEDLLAIAQSTIRKRVNDPDYVVKNGEEAYELHKDEWLQKFPGEFVAIHRRQVVAHAPTKKELWPLLKEAQKERGPFRAYVVKVGEPITVFRGPMRMRGRRFL